jgi:type 1 glutamine amidotransferase
MALPAWSAPARKLLFFTKSSGYEHDVISWKKGKPSFAEKQFEELGKKNHWTFEFSKDGSKFSPDYLKQFDAVIFYTTGDLTSKGTDGEPPMTPEGKQALFDYVKGGKGFVGIHSASDTFHTANGAKEPDDYIKFLGGEFVAHGAQQKATCTVVDAKFPGFKEVPATFSFDEEWYALKNLNPDMHALTVIDAPKMSGGMYERPPYPNTWAREEGKGRVFYTALGHREDVWTNPIFREILTGAIHWTTGDSEAAVPPNMKSAAPEADKLGK